MGPFRRLLDELYLRSPLPRLARDGRGEGALEGLHAQQMQDVHLASAAGSGLDVRALAATQPGQPQPLRPVFAKC
jgi:hypothetical protein